MDINNYDEFFDENPLRNFYSIPEEFRTREMWIQVICMDPIAFAGKIPAKYNDQEFWNFVYKNINRRLFTALFYLIPEEFRTKDMWKELVLKNPAFYEKREKVSDRYNNQEFWNEILNGICLPSLPNFNYNVVFRQIPRKFMTMEIWADIMAKKPGEFNNMLPKEYNNQELWIQVINNNKSYHAFKQIPDEFKTEDMWISQIAQAPGFIFGMLPLKYNNQEFWIKLFPKLNSKTQLSNFFKFIPSEFMTKEMWEKAIEMDFKKYFETLPNRFRDKETWLKSLNMDFNKYFDMLPDEYKTKEIWLMAIEFDCKKYLPLIPKRFMSEKMCLELLKKNPKLYLEFGDFNKIPASVCDDFLIDLVANMIRKNMTFKGDNYLLNQVITKYPELLYGALECSETQRILTNELYNLLGTDITIEEIALKYNLNSHLAFDLILGELEKIDKDKYQKLRVKIADNRSKYYSDRIEAIEKVTEYITSIGSFNNMSSFQKINFSYLFYKNINFSLEDLYLFNMRLKKNKSTLLDNFCNKVLKYDIFLDVSNKSEAINKIRSDNSWFYPYSYEETFKVKDGKPTVKYILVSNGVALDKKGEEKIIDVLIKNNIPLISSIVVRAFRAYLENSLNDFILRLSSLSEVNMSRGTRT